MLPTVFIAPLSHHAPTVFRIEQGPTAIGQIVIGKSARSGNADSHCSPRICLMSGHHCPLPQAPLARSRPAPSPSTSPSSDFTFPVRARLPTCLEDLLTRIQGTGGRPGGGGQPGGN